MKDICCSAEHQEKATFWLGSELVLSTNSHNFVLNIADATNISKINISTIEWYVPFYIASISQQTILSRQILSEIPTKLQYVDRTVFMKEVNTQNLWTFDLGTEEDINIPIWIIVGFQRWESQDSQNLNNDTFFKPPVASAQCIIGTEKYLDAGFFLKYEEDDYSHSYGAIKEAFRLFTKDDNLTPNVSDIDFRSSDNGHDVGYNLYVFDIRYEKNLEAAQPTKIDFKISENVPAEIDGYALVLTIELVSISSDRQCHLDLI